MKLKKFAANLIKNLHKNFFLKKEYYGYHMFLNELSLKGLGILNCGDDTEGEIFFLRNLFNNNKFEIIFDVGANIGDYSIQVRRLAPYSTIYAFEPHPYSFEKLLKISEELNIKAYNLGCGKNNEKLEIFDCIDNDGSTGASLFRESIEFLRNRKSIKHNVEVIKLDDFVLKMKIELIDLLKIDVEGNELNVIKGAQKIIKDNRVNVIQFEFNDINVISRVFFKDFYDILDKYDFYRMLPNGLIPMDKYNPITHEIFAFQNIIAIRSGLNISLNGLI